MGLEGDTIEARELDSLREEELKRTANHTSIFARAEPRHKVMILRALKDGHEVVLMTGDGVKDAPALRNADVGVAMGIKGTDVARDTADMVLLDDNLATIVAAVEEGRRIFRNIKKFVNYMLTGNLAEVLVSLVATAFGYLPITAVQILWINLVTDSGPAVALASDPSPLARCGIRLATARYWDAPWRPSLAALASSRRPSCWAHSSSAWNCGTLRQRER